MHDGDAPVVGLLGEAVGLVREEDGDRSHEDRQGLAGDGQRDGHTDGGRDGALGGGGVTDRGHGDDGGDGGRQGGVGGHGGTDVHPAQGEQLQGATDHDADGGVAQGDTGQGAGDERAVELPLVQDAGHTRDERHERDQNDLDQIDVMHGMSLSCEG